MAENILAVERLERRAIERDSFLDCEPGFLRDRFGQRARDDVVMVADFQRDVIETSR